MLSKDSREWRLSPTFVYIYIYVYTFKIAHPFLPPKQPKGIKKKKTGSLLECCFGGLKVAEQLNKWVPGIGVYLYLCPCPCPWPGPQLHLVFGGCWAGPLKWCFNESFITSMCHELAAPEMGFNGLGFVQREPRIMASFPQRNPKC